MHLAGGAHRQGVVIAQRPCGIEGTYSIRWLPAEQAEQHAQHDTDDDHRGDREEEPTALRLDADIADAATKSRKQEAQAGRKSPRISGQ
jgi:hypothetical protein